PYRRCLWRSSDSQCGNGVLHGFRHPSQNTCLIRQVDDVVFGDRHEFSIRPLRQGDQEHTIRRRDRDHHLHSGISPLHHLQKLLFPRFHLIHRFLPSPSPRKSAGIKGRRRGLSECAHRATTASSWGLCEQGEAPPSPVLHLTASSRHHLFDFRHNHFCSSQTHTTDTLPPDYALLID